ncbi:MAG: prolyl-tRNA, partial [Prolixibacteraceae bacterium]
MKSKFTYLGLMAILMSACSTGSYVSSSYSDDIYFNPGDVPPPIVVEPGSEQQLAREKSGSTIIVSEIGENEEGANVMNNYIFDGSESDVNALQYSVEQGLEGSDTTIYYNDDEVKYVINNYYDGDEIDFAYRIRRFHNPYFYDPFYWDSWYYDPFHSYGYGYYPRWSYAFNWGWGYPYYGWGYPYYGWGHHGYGWGYPGYGWGYHPPFFGGRFYSPVYVVDSDNYQYGQRRSSGTNVARGGSSSNIAQ